VPLDVHADSWAVDPFETFSLRGHVDDVSAVFLSGETIISGCRDGTIALTPLPSDTLTPSINPLAAHSSLVRSVAVAPISQTFATCADDIRLWPLDSPSSPQAVLAGHEHFVSALYPPSPSHAYVLEPILAMAASSRQAGIQPFAFGPPPLGNRLR
jgi:WD40 repeat protein